MSGVISISLFDEHCRLHHHANVGMVSIYDCGGIPQLIGRNRQEERANKK